ncbi:MAG TPA: 50S ribosomal protein L25 [Candidatus Hydrogenedens sp.]|nr:50S ribosomal protein L25 [Candidatus Hydrogenedens sp.]
MEIPVIKAQLRTKEGKSSTKKVRKEGNIPSVLYGMKEQTVPLKMDAKTFAKMLSHLEGKHPIVKLEIEGDAHLDSPAIIKEIQRDPVSNSIIHVDFQKIRLDQKIHTSVPVILVGQSEGVKMGGVLDHQLRELEIECLALQIPVHIEIDVTNLILGHSIHVADITPPEGVKILTDSDRVVVSIHVPRTLEAKAATEEEKPEEGAEETKEAEEEKE